LIGDDVPCLFDVDEQGQFRGIKVEDAEKKAQAAAQQTIASSSTIPDAQKQTLIGNLSTYDLFPLTHDLKTAIVSNQLTAVGVTGPANNNNTKAIVQSTEMAVAPITRPTDVACGIRVLPWSIARWDFGRSVAENFIAVQVTVRNLNNDQQFLIHDVELAVDTQPGIFNRFRSSVDQSTVHGVAANAEEGWRSRTFWLQLATFIGTVSSAANVPIRASGFREAVGGYQGGFIPGLNKLLKDHTLDQVSYLDSEAFSNASTRKIIVAKKDSATFYSFMPSASLLGVDWTNIYKYRALHEDPQSVEWFLRSGKKKAYKDWTPTDLQGLDGSTYVIVAGSHIQETGTQTTVSSVSCQPSTDTTLDLSKILPAATATCTLKGTGLEFVAQMILENSADPADKTYPTGEASVSGGDTTQASITFQTANLLSAKGKGYTVYYSVKNGIPQRTDLSLTVQQPALKPTTSSVDFGTVAHATTTPGKQITFTNTTAASVISKTATVAGTNGGDFSVVAAGNTCTASGGVAASTTCTVSVTFTAGAASQATENGTLILKDSSGSVTGAVLLTGKVQ
jgi:hypothetical protein